MSRITRVPFGLQDLLGSTNQGDNPSEFGGNVAPTLDLSRFLESERRSFVRGEFRNAANDGANAAIDVPIGELWFVDAVGALLNTTGLGPFHCELGWVCSRMNNSNSPFLLPFAGLGPFDAPNPSGFSNSLTYEFPRPVPLFGGERLELYLSQGDFSSTQRYGVTPMVRYTRLSV